MSNPRTPLLTAETPAAKPHHLARGYRNPTVKHVVLYWNQGKQEPGTSLCLVTPEIVYTTSFIFAQLQYPLCPNLNVLVFHHMKISHISLKSLYCAFRLMFHWLGLNFAVRCCQKTLTWGLEREQTDHNGNSLLPLNKKHTFCTRLTLQQVFKNDWPCKFLIEWDAEKLMTRC